MKQLGDILLDGGLLTPEQLQVAVEEQRRLGRSLGRVLVDLGVLTEGQLVAALAQQIGLRFVDLSDQAVDPDAVALVPEAVCRRHTALPLGYEDGRLLVAMADPANVVAVDDLRSLTGRDVKAVVATKPDVLAAIDRHHRSEVEPTSALGRSDPAGEEPARLRATGEDVPVVRFLDLLIDQAVQDRASDIHLEPGERDLRVRFRIDGVLHEVVRAPRSVGAGVASRLKVLADVDSSEHRLPQDGRLTVTAAGKEVDLRLATLPTVWGEKIVLRILDRSAAMLSLADLGFGEANAARYARGWAKPDGLVLVTGPTGSGRSTTLYATLGVLSRSEVDVVTVEDPVERRLPGVNQVQTDATTGLTAARALRCVLRSDPDVVLLGEVRDAETAHLAVEAALTGSLVLSSLHTKDAPSAVVRLTEMGVEPFLVGSALECVLAQRLARRLCGRCKEPYVAAPALQEAGLAWSPDEPPPTLYRAAGCAGCAGTGYSGRLALHEVMAVTEEVERLAGARESAATIGRLAREQGMVSLREDGLSKVLAGATSLEEVLRVAV